MPDDTPRNPPERGLMADTDWTVPTLKDHFDAILDEQRRGMLVAEREREKAAAALRDELERAIREGDRSLMQHISNQVEQINAALESAEKLELARVEAAKRQTEAVQRELTISQKESEKAIVKAEEQAKEWRDNANEWRGQSADRERSQQQEVAKMSNELMPREVADTQFNELRTAVLNLTRRLDRLE